MRCFLVSYTKNTYLLCVLRYKVFFEFDESAWPKFVVAGLVTSHVNAKPNKSATVAIAESTLLVL